MAKVHRRSGMIAALRAIEVKGVGRKFNKLAQFHFVNVFTLILERVSSVGVDDSGNMTEES